MPIAYISLLIETKRPLLVWDNPQRAVKQNMNVVISMLICMAYVIVLGFAAFILTRIFGVKTAIAVIFAAVLVIAIMSDRITRRKFADWFPRIEV
jgi:ABC-2 type transport system permease protein